MLVAASFAAGVVGPGLAAGVEVLAGVLTGDGALGAGVSVPPKEKPPVLAAGVADAESLDASFAAPPKLNPPAAGAAAVSAGLGADDAPPNEKPPIHVCIFVLAWF